MLNDKMRLLNKHDGSRRVGSSRSAGSIADQLWMNVQHHHKVPEGRKALHIHRQTSFRFMFLI